MRVIAGLIGVVVVVIASLQAAAEPSQNGSEIVRREQEARTREFERRYRFADWQGKDRAPLQLARFRPQLDLVGLPIKPERGTFVPRVMRFDQVRFVDCPFWMMQVDKDGRTGDGNKLHVHFRVYASAADAQRALMDSVSSMMTNRSPDPGDGPAFGEHILEGIGDVCIASPVYEGGYQRVQCVESNVWFSLSMARPSQAISDRMLDITRGLVENLRKADEESRRLGLGAGQGRVVLKKARIDQSTRRAVVVDEQPVTSVTAEPGQQTMVLFELVGVDAEELPTLRRAAWSSAGTIHHENDQRRGTTDATAVVIDPAKKGMQRVVVVVQHPDGGFEIMDVPIEVR